MQVPTRAVLRRSLSAANNDSALNRNSGESIAGGSLDCDSATSGRVRCGSGLPQVHRCLATPHPLGRRPACRDGPSAGRYLRHESVSSSHG